MLQLEIEAKTPAFLSSVTMSVKHCICSTVLLFHCSQFDCYFLPSKVIEINSERIEFSFRKKNDSFFIAIVQGNN